jgi:heptosyltransferase-2
MKSSIKTNELIVRLPNWVGDVIMALPAIALLQTLPWRITLLGRPWIHTLLAAYPFELSVLPKASRDAIARLKAQPAQRLLLMTNSFSSALVGCLAGKQTMGYTGDGRSLLLSHRLPRQHDVHETERFLFLARHALQLWGECDADVPAMPHPQLQLTSDASTQAQALLALHRVPKRFIVLCPFAHGLPTQKNSRIWPHWHALSRALDGFHPIICPGPNEVEEAKRLFPHVQCLEHVSLECYAAILARAELAIANDSGPLHLAAAVNCPTLGLFGNSDPKRTAPANTQVLGEYGQWPNVLDVEKLLKNS